MLCAACSEGTTREVSAMPLALEGRCELVHHDNAPVAVSPGSRVRAGDRLRVDAGGRASMALLPNVLVELSQSAEVEVLELSITKDGNETGDAMRRRTVRCRLLRGALVVSQEEEPEMTAGLRLVVETPAGEASTNFDAIFRVEVERETQRTRVLCASGRISFGAKDTADGVTLKPGTAGEWPSASGDTVQLVESDAAAQADLAAAFERASFLRASRDRLRGVLPLALGQDRAPQQILPR